MIQDLIFSLIASTFCAFPELSGHWRKDTCENEYKHYLYSADEIIDKILIPVKHIALEKGHWTLQEIYK